jgi:predicted nucleic acid-binding protein
MINILYENNLILDLVDASRPRHNLIIETIQNNFLFASSFISATTAERLYYQMDRLDFDKSEVDSTVNKFEIAPVTQDEIILAQELYDKSSDYEDAIEISICKLQNINIFVTADKKLSNKIQRLRIPNLEVRYIKLNL